MGIATASDKIGYVFIVMAIFITAFSSGTEFDLEKRMVRQFYSFFNIKKGNWLSLNNYTSISIKQTRKGYRTHSRANTSSVDTINSRYEVYLVSHKRSESIMLFDSKNKTDSKNLAETCAEVTGLNITRYGAVSRPYSSSSSQ